MTLPRYQQDRDHPIGKELARVKATGCRRNAQGCGNPWITILKVVPLGSFENINLSHACAFTDFESTRRGTLHGRLNHHIVEAFNFINIRMSPASREQIEARTYTQRRNRAHPPRQSGHVVIRAGRAANLGGMGSSARRIGTIRLPYAPAGPPEALFREFMRPRLGWTRTQHREVCGDRRPGPGMR